MKIPSQTPASLQAPSSQPARPAPATAAAQPGSAVPVASGDHATWSASAAALTAQALQQPAVRSALVAHYRSQIASGAYHVAAAPLAAAMLDDPLTGLRKQGSA